MDCFLSVKFATSLVPLLAGGLNQIKIRDRKEQKIGTETQTVALVKSKDFSQESPRISFHLAAVNLFS